MLKRKLMPILATLMLMWMMVPGMVWAGAYCNGSEHTENPEVNSALGCVPVRIDSFMIWLLPKVFGIAGGISFLLMAYGFIMMTTSSGDPKAVQGAKETISSAITGLVVCILAVFLLRLIAVGVLKIPGIK